jgi:hypothetical protein
MRPCRGVVGDHTAEADVGELCIGEVSTEKYGPIQVQGGTSKIGTARLARSKLECLKQAEGKLYLLSSASRRSTLR